MNNFFTTISIVPLALLLGGCPSKQPDISNSIPAEMELIEANTPNSQPVFSSVSEISHVVPVDPGAAPRSIDGHNATPEHWAGILVTRAPGDGKCTSTLVGRNTILTAAHCVDRKDGPPSTSYDISFDFEGSIYPFECEMAADYANSAISIYVRSTRDVALCKALRPLPNSFVQNSEFEVMDLNHPIADDDKILLGGYGCVIDRVPADDGTLVYVRKWDNPGEETYRIGNNKIEDAFRDRADGQGHIMSSFTSVSAVNDKYTDVCQGDSGGPIFFNVDWQNETSPRRIIGVVSGNNLQLPYRAYSAYTDIGQKDAAAFFNKWLADHPGQEICGVNVEAGTNGCKQ